MHSHTADDRGAWPYVVTHLTRPLSLGEVAGLIAQAASLPAPLTEVA